MSDVSLFVRAIGFGAIFNNIRQGFLPLANSESHRYGDEIDCKTELNIYCFAIISLQAVPKAIALGVANG